MFDGNQWGMFQTILLLFIVLDPFGNLVLINSLLKDYSMAAQNPEKSSGSHADFGTNGPNIPGRDSLAG